MPLAQLALFAACRGEPTTTSCWPIWITSPPGSRRGSSVSLMHDTRRWAQGSRAALAGDAGGRAAPLRQMTQPTLTRLAAYDRVEIAVKTGHLDTA